MSSELATKLQLTAWWIVSIAVSVLCCSVIFVLFASYLVDMRESVRDSYTRIRQIEEREDRILAELESMHKHLLVQNPAVLGASSVSATVPEVIQPNVTPSPAPAGATTPAPVMPDKK